MNEIRVTLRGNVASDPRHVQFDDGNILTSFRLASTARRYDRRSDEWVDQGTTYVNVTCRKAMAANAAVSIHKGQPVLVTGRLWERQWSKNERSGRSLEIQAEGIGHDLTYGTAQFARLVRPERISQPVDVSGLEVVEEEYDEDGDRAGADVEVVDGSEMLDESARAGVESDRAGVESDRPVEDLSVTG